MQTILFYPQITWAWFNKFLLRFGVLFFGIYLISGFSLIITEAAYSFYPWVGAVILKLQKPITDFPSGSGDTTYNYVELLVCFVLALMSAIIWSLFNKNEKHYDTFLHWFLIVLRYFLVYQLLGYGYAKLFYLQFGQPNLMRLLEPYGQSTPMGIAWTFIGLSKPYTVISGALEILAAVLLLFRRTTLAGGLLALVLMFNIMLINYCYDVPVKIFSTQLVIYSIIIIACNGYALYCVLWTHKSVNATEFKSVFTPKKLNITRIILKALFILYFIGFDGYSQYQTIAEYGEGRPKPPLQGIYKSTQLIKNNDTLRLFSDSTLIKTLAIGNWDNHAYVYQVNDRRYGLSFKIDTIKKTILANSFLDTLVKYTLNYKMLNDTLLNINGIYKKDTINYTFNKVNLKATFPLIGTGFNWVNEFPNNR